MKRQFLLCMTLWTLAVVPYASAQELRTLATHEEPTKEQVALLSVDLDKLDAQAAAANVEVVRDGDDILLFDADLYNIRRMSLCIRGFDVLARLARDGKTMFKLGDLADGDKRAVREILLAQGVAEDAGPALFDDKSPVSIGMSWRIECQAGGKSVAFNAGHAPVSDFKQRQKYTSKEVQKFDKDELPRQWTKWHSIDEVRFRHSAGLRLVSTRRAGAVAKIEKIMEERIEKQSKDYEDRQAALKSAFLSKDSPSAQEQARALPDKLKADMVGGWRSLGFASQDAAGSFLDSASITTVTPTVMISIGWLGDQVGRGTAVTTNVNRRG